GLVILLEGTRAHRWVDVTFGLTEGWWRFADEDLRPAYPLLDPARWRALLEDVGFSSAASVYGDAEGLGLGRQSILVAREPLATAAAAEPATAWPAGRLLVLGDGSGLGASVAALAGAAGAKAFHVADPSSDALRGALTAARAEDTAEELHVLYLAALDAPGLEAGGTQELLARQVQSAGAFVAVLSALLATGGKARLDVVTRGAQSTADSEGVAAPLQALLWGLGRVAALEHPGLFGRLVDLDPAGAVGEARTLLDEVRLGDGEDQVAFRVGVRHVARLQKVPAPGPESLLVRPDGIHLVTGGLGGLGLSLARWLVERGARDLVLTSRRGLPPREQWDSLPAGSESARQAAVVREIEAKGARVEVTAIDVADEARMRTLIAGLAERAPLRTVFHLAADMTSRALAETDTAALAGMLKPKIAGAANL
ncbi:MAG TPA: KR domain-containing protein, partial [Gemmatimonadales bacterium]|nr:KR domain-containing protein [Gemmatimonadales bacterium]